MKANLCSAQLWVSGMTSIFSVIDIAMFHFYFMPNTVVVYDWCQMLKAKSIAICQICSLKNFPPQHLWSTLSILDHALRQNTSITWLLPVASDLWLVNHQVIGYSNCASLYEKNHVECKTSMNLSIGNNTRVLWLLEQHGMSVKSPNTLCYCSIIVCLHMSYGLLGTRSSADQTVSEFQSEPFSARRVRFS